jgi:hypothetical protein
VRVVSPAEVLSTTALFLALCLVTLRLSWLLIEDAITAGPRRWIRGRLEFGQHYKAKAFFGCPWCIGFWAAVALVAVLDAWWLNVPLVGLWPFAINMVVAPAHAWLDAKLP